MEIKDYPAKKHPYKTIGEHAQDLKDAAATLYKMGYIREEGIYHMLLLACEHHDDGKANPEFQKRITSDKWIKFNPEKEIPHNVLSLLLLNRRQFESKEVYRIVAHAILHHHNYNDVFQLIREKGELMQTLLKDWTYYPCRPSEIKNLAKGELFESREAVLVKGLLHKCDYSASANYKVEYQNDFLEESLDRLKAGWQKKDPKAGWKEIQRFSIQHRDKNMIVVAQTGMGKTEAGLLWIGNTKGFFILPLRTAINAIYDRVRTEILQGEQIHERLAILHSEALQHYTGNLEDEEETLLSYYKRGKRLSIPLNISTMDQLFDFIFLYSGFELKLSTLSYAKIVIDEIQMYTPDLLAYLVYGMEQIVRVGGKIAILTATLSPFIRDKLLGIFPKEELVQETFVEDSLERHSVKVCENRLLAEDIWKRYRQNEADGRSNKILVICNTIKKAQAMYGQLRDLFSGEEEEPPLHLLHSRFVRKERAEKEGEILQFGKTYTADHVLDHQSGIWVSTSLVEASLDIDFDYLFTELQDLSSLFQRLGRCNRQGAKPVKDYNCFVYTGVDEKYLSSRNGFIDDTLFHLSKEALNKVDGLLTETKKVTLINEFLTTENLKDSKYAKEYESSYAFIKDIPPYKFEPKEGQLRNVLTKTILPQPVYEENIEKIKKCEERLMQHNLSPVERLRLREAILDYSVNVPLWHVKGKKNYSLELSLGGGESICVLECEYDALGYRPQKG